MNYFAGDFKPVNTSVNPFPNYSAFLGVNYRPLYNGNISSSSAHYQRFETFPIPGAPGPLVFYNYKYDQLNRLTRMDAFQGFNTSSNSWSGMTPVANEALKERVKYDGNGNIQQYVRRSVAGTAMDSLNYTYYPGTNRLRRITDPHGASSNWQDLDNQTDANNYKYDSIGNLTGDVAETITDIKWNVYGKIKQIIKNNNGSQYLSRNNIYGYDAQGNRISAASYIDEHWYYTWYVRDAQGNILSNYSARSDDPNNHQNANLIQDERHIYGSSRLGSYTSSEVDWIDNSNTGPQDWAGKTTLSNDRQKKQYELTNHLGNVTTTLTDFRIAIPLSGSPSITGQFKGDITGAVEYYPFGMASRGTQDGNYYYRFGFNGKENDNEIKGGFGKQQDYGMRIYDPRLARFLSVDPLDKIFPELTPYQFASNRPVDGIDLDGQEYLRRVHIVDQNKQVISTKDIPYYLMQEQQLLAVGGTPASFINAAGYGPEGKGVKHEYLYADGTQAMASKWEERQNDINGKIAFHGLYSGPGAVTKRGQNSTDYDLSWPPIDASDAIAKRHDMNYVKGAPTDYQGFIEDTRTLAADNQMVAEVKNYLSTSGTPILRPANAPHNQPRLWHPLLVSYL